MADPQSTLNQIRRLLANCRTDEDDGDEALRLHGYLTAVEGFDIALIEAGVDILLRGELPGYDGRYRARPAPPQLATACRIAADREARTRYIDGIGAPRLPAPDIVKTDEQRQRVRERVQAFIKGQQATDVHQDAEQVARVQDSWNRTNVRFQPPMDDASVARRLMGYDPAAGGRRHQSEPDVPALDDRRFAEGF